jgi:hypothetical protein
MEERSHFLSTNQNEKRLTCNGVPLDADTRLCQSSVKNGSIIRVTLRILGGVREEELSPFELERSPPTGIVPFRPFTAYSHEDDVLMTGRDVFHHSIDPLATDSLHFLWQACVEEERITSQ